MFLLSAQHSPLLAHCTLYFVLCTLFFLDASAQPLLQSKATESLKKMFGDSVAVTLSKVVLGADEKKKIFEQSKSQWLSDTVKVYSCKNKNEVVGFGFVDDVKGKVQLITYLVSLKPSGEVVDVDVLAYREAYGGEITYESFRKQFRGKGFNDKLLSGKDIKNISGATLSVRAITLGVKRVLTTYELIKERLEK
ncbi:MAG: FMN-binding protein [Ignavibacteriae bacterium]|nr:FMN-binding protein [Ignavibacteriota bacterium]